MLGIFLVLNQLRLFLTSTFPACHLPTGSPGLCVPLGQCGHLTSLLGNLQPPLAKDVALLIRESFFCDRTDGGVQVCCPVQGIIGDRWVFVSFIEIHILFFKIFVLLSVPSPHQRPKTVATASSRLVSRLTVFSTPSVRPSWN